jgi:polyisoprenoid-binding protein YceI
LATHQITAGTFHILTFKEGLLSKIAHDLRISAPRFEITIDGDKVSGRVQARELVIDGAMKKGTLNPKTLSDKDKRDIKGNIDKDVLKTAKHPEIRFEGTAQGADGPRFRVEGQLELVGRKGPLTLQVQRQGDTLRATAEIVQTRFGVKPYSAMLGTLKVKDRLEIVVEVADPTR